MRVDFEYLSRPIHGESVCGDTVIIRKEDDVTLFGVIDALGHGPGAASTAELAKTYLEEASIQQGLHGLIEGLHQALRGSRGAAALLCLFSNGLLTASGVGNVELRNLGSPVSLFLVPGVLGTRVRKIKVFEANLVAGDRLILYSDGISSHFSVKELQDLTARQVCERLMSQHGRVNDDATVLIADIADDLMT